MQTPFVLAIAGPSGAGKSSTSQLLVDKLADATVIDIDWYFKPAEAVPAFNKEYRNWDSPKALAIDLFLQDVKQLIAGESISFANRSLRCNKKENCPQDVASAETLILEGYLSLHDDRVRKFVDYAVYLQPDQDIAIERRTSIKTAAYVEDILIPMQKKYVEPTKKHADIVIDIGNKSRQEVVECVLESFTNAQKLV